MVYRKECAAPIIFGIMSLILLLYALVYGFYDMATGTGTFAGLEGNPK